MLAFSAHGVRAQQQQQSATCPMHEKHASAEAKADRKAGAQHPMSHDATKEMNERGERAMGFSQGATTHHFRLLKDGGAIEVETNDARDMDTREQIRQHLAHIAASFTVGDFDVPMFIHDQVPPGVPVMKRLKEDINYEYENTERGARIRIKTANAEALAAVQDFLRFQITEHQTNDKK
jgi:hypothetical protein